MNNVVALKDHQHLANQSQHFDHNQIAILKNSICKGVSDDEFAVFLMACQRTQLDPFMKQIYAIPRKSKKADGSWGQSMTIQTSIDGYRLIAERTGCYAPGPEPTYAYDANGALVSASSYIRKQTKDGTWHTISASAYIDEYMQCFVDRSTGEKKPTGLWVNMPRTMLAKCAEAQALRKAFPAEMSGVYTKEEMAQADVEEIQPAQLPAASHYTISIPQHHNLKEILSKCDPKYKEKVLEHLKKEFNCTLSTTPSHLYEKIRIAALENSKKYEEWRNTPEKQQEAQLDYLSNDSKERRKREAEALLEQKRLEEQAKIIQEQMNEIEVVDLMESEA